jgi:hypothetical protein
MIVGTHYQNITTHDFLLIEGTLRQGEVWLKSEFGLERSRMQTTSRMVGVLKAFVYRLGHP